MKTLTINTVTVTGTDVTIEGTLSDVTYTQPAQQVTIADRPAGNTVWTRAIQMTDEAIMCKRYGSTPFAMGVTSFAMLAFTVEPDLTWPIEITTQPSTPAAFAPNGTLHADLTVVVSTNEVTTTYQWQKSDTAGDTWTTPVDLSNGATGDGSSGCTYAGATTASLTITPANLNTARDGYYYRCKVTNAQGDPLYSTAVKLDLTP